MSETLDETLDAGQTSFVPSAISTPRSTDNDTSHGNTLSPFWRAALQDFTIFRDETSSGQDYGPATAKDDEEVHCVCDAVVAMAGFEVLAHLRVTPITAGKKALQWEYAEVLAQKIERAGLLSLRIKPTCNFCYYVAKKLHRRVEVRLPLDDAQWRAQHHLPLGITRKMHTKDTFIEHIASSRRGSNYAQPPLIAYDHVKTVLPIVEPPSPPRRSASGGYLVDIATNTD